MAAGDASSIPPIPEWLLYPSEILGELWVAIFGRDDPTPPECEDFVRFRPAALSCPIAHVEIPQHPYMASNAGNNMHCDSYISDAYEAAGPL